jgi:hypothetical protein
MTANEIRIAIENLNPRGAWNKAVQAYALELLDNLDETKNYTVRDCIKTDLLNGADNWSQYSWGGCSLIYDSNIAHRVCNPTELKRTNGGEKSPNPTEEWLDVQARALGQAYRLIIAHC